MSGQQWFVDETKTFGLTMAIVRVGTTDIGRCRSQISKLRRTGQSGLHFKRESDSARTKAYRLIATMPINVALVNVPSGVKPVKARERAVRHIARQAVERHPSRIVFELDEAALNNDKRWLRSELAGTGIEYQHLTKTGDPMLWIADGIAWSVQRGGKWRAMINHLIVETDWA